MPRFPFQKKVRAKLKAEIRSREMYNKQRYGSEEAAERTGMRRMPREQKLLREELSVIGNMFIKVVERNRLSPKKRKENRLDGLMKKDKPIKI